LSLPNIYPQSLISSLPSWFPTKQMTLGLDLQGGSHILLKIDTNDLIKAQLESARDEIRTQLRDARIGYTGLSGTGKVVQVRIRDAGQVAAAKAALTSLTTPVSSGLFGSGSVTEMSMDEPEPGVLRFTMTDAGIQYRTATA